MRPPQHSQKNSVWHLALAAVAILSSALGCRNGFLDPTEMGRYERKPLMMPILKILDTGYDEVDARWRQIDYVRAEDLQPSRLDYRLGANDVLFVSITDLVQPGGESQKQVRISESGKISLPLLGPIQAAGLTESQLETAISQAYKDKGYIQNAQVTVTVIQTQNRTFAIWGAVNSSGEFPIPRADFRLRTAIGSYARGTTSVNIDYLYVVRRINREGGEAQPGPATRPNTDVLMPRSRAGSAPDAVGQAPGKTAPAAMLLIQPADQPADVPATTPATQPGDQEGRMITIEGQSIPTDGRPVRDRMPERTAEPAEGERRPETQRPADDFEFNAPPAPTDVRIIRVPLQPLLDGDLRWDIVVRPGDEIYVENPTIGEYYMGGNVARVGVYSTFARKITLKQAVVSAGMLNQLGVPQRTQIVRRLQGQDREIYTMVDLAKIFSGEQPDIYLKPDDVVTVGTAWWAPFVASIRNGFRITYGFGFLYDRNYYNPNNQ